MYNGSYIIRRIFTGDIYIFSEAPCSSKSQVSPPPKKRLRSSIEGPLHDPSVCIWCRVGKDERHPGRKNYELFRIGSLPAWAAFKRHPITINDIDLRNRITQLIETTTDPFAADIMYHKKCWDKYISNSSLKDSDPLHLQNVSKSDARNLFYRHVDEVIFEQHEIRSLQSLLQDYKTIMSNYGFPVGDMKSSYLKELLESLDFKYAMKRH